ncbi:biotin--[acetyl-CoA-carboxylase] ligase [Bacteroidota bacterium]
MKREVFTYEVLDSTNEEAIRILSSRVQKWPFFVRADYQTAGRGRSANFWISEKGKNLLLSWIVFPEFLSVTHQFQLSKSVSLAIVDMLKQFGIDAAIKWPNDIIAEKKKLGGILIEHSITAYSIRHTIIGIGININQVDFPDFPYEATSMHNVGGNRFSVEDVSHAQITALERRYGQLEQEKHAELNAAYLKHLYMLNKEARFSADNREFRATIRGVNDLGELLLEGKDGLMNYGFHQIKMHY